MSRSSQQPLVSVIVAVRHGEQTLEALCRSVQNQTYEPLELVVVDNSDTDATAAIARAFTDQVFRDGPERSAQRNRGMAEAVGDFLLILDADMTIPPNLVEEAVSRFTADPELACLFVPEETTAEGLWGRCKKFERDFYRAGDLSAEAVRFFRKTAIEQVGDFDEMQTGSEDWDLSDRCIFVHGLKYGRTTAALVHHEGRIRLADLLKKKRYYIRQGIGPYLKTSPNPYRRLPFFLRPSVRAHPGRWLRHPVLAAGTLFMKGLEAVPLLTTGGESESCHTHSISP